MRFSASSASWRSIWKFVIIELDKKLSLTEKARKLSLFLLVYRLENLKMTILVIAWFEQEQRKKRRGEAAA